MCAVSMIGDHYADKWGKNPWWPGPPVTPTAPIVPWPGNPPAKPPHRNPFDIFKTEEIAILRKEVEELKRLLRRARQYDRDNDQPGCEIEEKMKKLAQVAKIAGYEDGYLDD